MERCSERFGKGTRRLTDLSFGALTRDSVSVLFSLGVLGFAVTFALQQPLFATSQPYRTLIDFRSDGVDVASPIETVELDTPE